MRDRLIAILGRFAPRTSTADRDSAADSILARYGEPHRAYHNVNHIADCLSHFDALCAAADQPDVVEFAI